MYMRCDEDTVSPSSAQSCVPACVVRLRAAHAQPWLAATISALAILGIVGPHPAAAEMPSVMTPTAGACTSDGSVQRIAIQFQPPPDENPSGATVMLRYPRERLTLGDAAGDAAARRLVDKPDQAIVAAKDLGGALRVVVATARGLHAGPLFTVEFSRCTNAAVAAAADLQCEIEDCASIYGHVAGCRCTTVASAP